MASAHAQLRPLRPLRRYSQTSKPFSPSSSPTSTTSTGSTSHCYFLPSSVPPSLTLTRPEFNRAPASAPNHTAATALLSRVARSGCSPPGSPKEKMSEKEFCDDEERRRRRSDQEMVEIDGHERMEWGEAMRYWQCNHGQGDGYISFPDFDYFDSYESSDQLDSQHQQQTVKT